MKDRWQYYNPNPKELVTGDCTIRALCKALDKDWDDVYIMTSAIGQIMKEMPSANRVWGAVLKDNGFARRDALDVLPPKFTVKDFCDAFPDGVYVLGLDGHVVTVIDGIYYDTWDSGNMRILYYWH